MHCRTGPHHALPGRGSLLCSKPRQPWEPSPFLAVPYHAVQRPAERCRTQQYRALPRKLLIHAKPSTTAPKRALPRPTLGCPAQPRKPWPVTLPNRTQHRHTMICHDVPNLGSHRPRSCVLPLPNRALQRRAMASRAAPNPGNLSGPGHAMPCRSEHCYATRNRATKIWNPLPNLAVPRIATPCLDGPRHTGPWKLVAFPCLAETGLATTCHTGWCLAAPYQASPGHT